MSLFGELLRRPSMLFRRSQFDADLEDEMRLNLDSDVTARSVANGCVYNDRIRSSGAAFRDGQRTKSELREPQQASEKRCLKLSCSPSAQR
jgi:hypothetical protein